jgi:hypothetical protein
MAIPGVNYKLLYDAIHNTNIYSKPVEDVTDINVSAVKAALLLAVQG